MGRHPTDLTGLTFGRLTALKRIGTKNRAALWECLCSCGQQVNVSANNLVRGDSRSCGCLRSELTTARSLKHGGIGTATYKTWAAMRSRCNRPNDDAYENYGGRGIKICERWEDFNNFYADMGDRPPGAGIDRINNDGDYEPSNCKWSTHKEQSNNRRVSALFAYQGRTQTLQQWADEYGLAKQCLWDRLNTLNWPIEKALTTPKRRKKL